MFMMFVLNNDPVLTHAFFRARSNLIKLLLVLIPGEEVR